MPERKGDPTLSVRRHNLSAPKAPLAVTFTTVLLLFSISCSRPAALTQGPSLAILYNAEEQPTEKSAVAHLLKSEFRRRESRCALTRCPIHFTTSDCPRGTLKLR